MRALREQFANDAPRLRSNVRRAASSVERVEEKLESVAVSYVVLALDVESPAYELEDLSLRVPARSSLSRLFTTDRRASIASKSIWSPSTRSRSFRRFDPTPLRLRDMTSARVRYKQRLDSIDPPSLPAYVTVDYAIHDACQQRRRGRLLNYN